MKRKNDVIAMTVTLILFLGCSGESWKAKFYMVRAEDTYTKAYELRTKKTAAEQRLKIFGEACNLFLKAYRADSKVFTLYRISLAFDACRRVGDTSAEDLFRSFETQYAEEHPTEVEYGDAMPPPLEG